MSSYKSDSSYLSVSPTSTNGSSFSSFAPSAAADSASVPIIPEEEPKDHPRLSTLNYDEMEYDASGFPVMQTKTEWEKQMKLKAKEDDRKARKAARKAKHAPPPPKEKVPLTKAQKKKAKHGEDADDADE